jgi:hypothetical protein
MTPNDKSTPASKAAQPGHPISFHDQLLRSQTIMKVKAKRKRGLLDKLRGLAPVTPSLPPLDRERWLASEILADLAILAVGGGLSFGVTRLTRGLPILTRSGMALAIGLGFVLCLAITRRALRFRARPVGGA